jgi:hypothetical protein
MALLQGADPEKKRNGSTTHPPQGVESRHSKLKIDRKRYTSNFNGLFQM